MANPRIHPTGNGVLRSPLPSGDAYRWTAMRSVSCLLLTIVLNAGARIAYADTQYQLIRYECDQKRNTVSVSLDAAYNEVGEALVAQAGRDAWDPWRLVNVDPSGDHIASTTTIKRRCRLKDGIYRVEIGPNVGNVNVQGGCGAEISVWTSIYRGPQLLASLELGGACILDDDKRVNVRVTVGAGSRKPSIKTKSYLEFSSVE